MQYGANRVKDINLSQVRKMFEQASPTAINLALGEPDFDTPKHIIDSLKDALDTKYTHYSQNKGEPELREAISKKLAKDNDINVSDDDIIVTVGASEALYTSIQALINPNDDVLIPDPGFLSYKECVTLSGANSIPVKSSAENGFKTTIEDVENSLTENTKAIIINSPCNPTGAVMDKENIKAISDLASDKEFIIFSDEIYEKIIYGKKHYSFQKYTDNAVTINGFSKSYAMTGLRIGYCASNHEIIDEILKVHQYNVACIDTPTQRACITALNSSQQCVTDMTNEFRKRRDLVVESLNNMGLDCIMPDGAFYVFFKHDTPEAFVKKAVKEDVILVPGAAFGSMGEKYIRLSYAQSYENLEEAMRRLEKIV
ncbi:pyridoxal phosphate-dependent aminotransferase [Methanosphaera sp. WGK6]|uniref:pyridoxal phosphate-dependent aminotransferase n=1 Tax=Methanosphaera sp. WGK6 TaxID=1561964 RepID=UPI00084C8C66|nr:pyridoxal phosphate-dependent aminotransferase [Methanosphaera sp. WGK6]OED30185.1 aspartate aminotransferase [Methanosphaera sp. WGK6]